MVQLNIFRHGGRPAPPTDPNSAALWTITQMPFPHHDQAYMGDWYPGTGEYKQEWRDALWHIDCVPLDEYVARALEKATPHKTPRIDMELPESLEIAHVRRGPQFIEAAVERMLSVLRNEHGDLVLNMIFLSHQCFESGFINELERAYKELVPR